MMLKQSSKDRQMSHVIPPIIRKSNVFNWLLDKREKL